MALLQQSVCFKRIFLIFTIKKVNKKAVLGLKNLIKWCYFLKMEFPAFQPLQQRP